VPYRLYVVFLTCFLLACSPPEQNEQVAQVSAEEALPTPQGSVVLTVSGNITHTNDGDKAVFDMQMLHELPHKHLQTDTSVTDGEQQFEGVLMRDVLRRVGATGSAVLLTALNDYTVQVPVQDFDAFDAVLAWAMNDELLQAKDKGPLWLVYPRSQHQELRDIRYDYRWVWQLVHVEVQ